MVNEEQQQEIEVLQSIYPDEITLLNDEEYRIRIALEVPPAYKNTDDVDDEEDEPPTITLHIKYPPTYPDVPPILDMALDHGSTSPTDDSLGLSFPADKEAILSALESTIEENLGMAMIFTLVTTIKDHAETLISTRVAAAEAKIEAAKRVEEEKEMAKFKGTPVNRETFMEWRRKFREEMEEVKRRKEKEKEEEEKTRRGATAAVNAANAMARRLTGKQLYERGMVGMEDDLEGEADGEEPDVGKLKIAAKT